MPRQPRIHIPNGYYHLTVRGDNREPIFVDDFDRQNYLGFFKSCKEKFLFTCYAYVLMTNHVHLLLTPGEKATISTIMHYLNLNYTKYFNRRYDRVGHLYQGRFDSRLIDSQRYLAEVVSYIHFNPVKAGMVSNPEEYFWSSYRAYLNPVSNGANLVDLISF